MNLAPVLRFVAYTHFAVAVAMVSPGLLAAAGGDDPQGHITGIVLCALIGTMCIAAGQGMRRRPPVRNGLRELLLALLLFWLALPLSAAIPLIADGLRFDEAWFEAVSALTTTGAWLSDPAARATPQDMLYRASLQAIGGLVSLATAAAVFVRPEFIGIAPPIPPFSRGETGSYLRAFDRAVWAFLPVYAVCALAGGVALVAAGVPAVPGMAMGLSFLASGGFVPIAGGLSAVSGPATVVSAVLMTLGAVNFVIVASFVLGQSATLRRGRDLETGAFLLLIPVVAIIFWLSRGAGDVDRLGHHVLNAISFLSTNGPTLSHRPELIPVLVTAVVGGAAVSTAGGIKILRWLVTFRRSGEEIWKLTHPGAVPRSKPSANELGVWIHALAFAMILAVLVLITAFYGYELEASAAAAVAVITNTGPLLDLAPLMTADYGVFDPSLRSFFMVGMIAGRLELVIMLVILNRRFWQG